MQSRGRCRFAIAEIAARTARLFDAGASVAPVSTLPRAAEPRAESAQSASLKLALAWGHLAPVARQEEMKIHVFVGFSG